MNPPFSTHTSSGSRALVVARDLGAELRDAGGDGGLVRAACRDEAVRGRSRGGPPGSRGGEAETGAAALGHGGAGQGSPLGADEGHARGGPPRRRGPDATPARPAASCSARRCSAGWAARSRARSTGRRPPRARRRARRAARARRPPAPRPRARLASAARVEAAQHRQHLVADAVAGRAVVGVGGVLAPRDAAAGELGPHLGARQVEQRADPGPGAVRQGRQGAHAAGRRQAVERRLRPVGCVWPVAIGAPAAAAAAASRRTVAQARLEVGAGGHAAVGDVERHAERRAEIAAGGLVAVGLGAAQAWATCRARTSCPARPAAARAASSRRRPRAAPAPARPGASRARSPDRRGHALVGGGRRAITTAWPAAPHRSCRARCSARAGPAPDPRRRRPAPPRAPLASAAEPLGQPRPQHLLARQLVAAAGQRQRPGAPEREQARQAARRPRRRPPAPSARARRRAAGARGRTARRPRRPGSPGRLDHGLVVEAQLEAVCPERREARRPASSGCSARSTGAPAPGRVRIGATAASVGR